MDQLFDVKGKTVYVTEARSGLGRAAATLLASRGARVVGIARRVEALADWQALTDGETAFVVGDLSVRSEITQIATDAACPFGPPDILINAAGINTRQHADDVTNEGWDQTMNLNLAAPFFLAQRNADQTCIGRNGESSDLDGPLMLFCGAASDYVTGQVLFVDGGYTAK